MDKNKKTILWFEEIGIVDVGLVGGKNASLGEMYRKLTKKGISLPNGFAITAYAFRQFLKFNRLEKEIANLLEAVDPGDAKSLEAVGRKIRNSVVKGKIPSSLASEIKHAYRKLTGHGSPGVAVRSSATAEDLPVASFAGQLESFLNVRDENLLQSVKKMFCLALHKPSHSLLRRSQIKSRENLRLGRNSEDGPFRPGFLGRNVHLRYGDRFSGRGFGERELGAWGKYCEGSGRARSVLYF